MMPAADHQSLGEALLAFAIKAGPGIAGSIVAMKFLPKDAPWIDRAMSFVGGWVSAYNLTPIILHWTGSTSEATHGGAAFLVGVFSMTVIGALTETIREVQLAAIATDALRRWLRIDRR